MVPEVPYVHMRMKENGKRPVSCSSLCEAQGEARRTWNPLLPGVMSSHTVPEKQGSVLMYLQMTTVHVKKKGEILQNM